MSPSAFVIISLFYVLKRKKEVVNRFSKFTTGVGRSRCEIKGQPASRPLFSSSIKPSLLQYRIQNTKNEIQNPQKSQDIQAAAVKKRASRLLGHYSPLQNPFSQNVFVSNCKMYLSQISKCICVNLICEIKRRLLPSHILYKTLSLQKSIKSKKSQARCSSRNIDGWAGVEALVNN